MLPTRCSVTPLKIAGFHRLYPELVPSGEEALTPAALTQLTPQTCLQPTRFSLVLTPGVVFVLEILPRGKKWYGINVFIHIIAAAGFSMLTLGNLAERLSAQCAVAVEGS